MSSAVWTSKAHPAYTSKSLYVNWIFIRAKRARLQVCFSEVREWCCLQCRGISGFDSTCTIVQFISFFRTIFGITVVKNGTNLSLFISSQIFSQLDDDGRTVRTLLTETFSKKNTKKPTSQQSHWRGQVAPSPVVITLLKLEKFES